MNMTAQKLSQEQQHPIQPDRVRMARVADDLLHLLDGYLPAGLVERAKGERPDVIGALNTSASELRAAVFAGDAKEFLTAVTCCTGVHERAVFWFEMAEKRARRIACSVTLTACEG